MLAFARHESSCYNQVELVPYEVLRIFLYTRLCKLNGSEVAALLHKCFGTEVFLGLWCGFIVDGNTFWEEVHGLIGMLLCGRFCFYVVGRCSRVLWHGR